MKLFQKSFLSGDSDSIRISTASLKGGRKYMEDEFSIVHYSPSQNEGKENAPPSIVKPFLFFGIFDGHGGDMASKYSRDNLCNNIICQHSFWSNDDSDVCRAIRNGFIATQKQMQAQVAYWPKTALGHMSTAGTTASIIFIMNGKYYTGHVGDSRIILVRENKTNKNWESFPLTRDHKPNAPEERTRIERAGGKVINKSGVSRVVWKRLKYNVTPSTLGTPPPSDFDVIPFLAVARALGDLWSYNKRRDLFIVSPEPDVKCVPITASDQCLILATDGLWNMMNNQTAVNHVRCFEKEDTEDTQYTNWDSSSGQLSHSAYLVEQCMKKWSKTRYRADNITVLTVMLDIDQSRKKLNDSLSYSRSNVDDEGNFFCPNLLGKMFHHFDDSSLSDSENDKKYSEMSNGHCSSEEYEVEQTIQNLIDNVCSQLCDLKCEQNSVDNSIKVYSNGFDKIDSSDTDKTDETFQPNEKSSIINENDKNNNKDKQQDVEFDDVGKDGKMNISVLNSSQMEKIHFTHVISSEGFCGYQDSFAETIHLDRTIFGSERLQEYSTQETPTYGCNSSILERSIAIINQNDLSYFHQEEIVENNIAESVISSKTINSSTQINGNSFTYEMRTSNAEIHCENSENACDFEMTLKRKIDKTDIIDSFSSVTADSNDITSDSMGCKSPVTKRHCSLNISYEIINESD